MLRCAPLGLTNFRDAAGVCLSRALRNLSPYGSFRPDNITIVILLRRCASPALEGFCTRLGGVFFAPSPGQDLRWVTILLLIRGCTSGCSHQAAGYMGQQVDLRVYERDFREI